MKVTVIDKIERTEDVSAAQALAYLRRTLRAEDGWQEFAPASLHFVVFEHTRQARYVDLPKHDGAHDFPRLLADTCDALVRAGVVAQPSEALRAMAAEGL